APGYQETLRVFPPDTGVSAEPRHHGPRSEPDRFVDGPGTAGTNSGLATDAQARPFGRGDRLGRDTDPGSIRKPDRPGASDPQWHSLYLGRHPGTGALFVPASAGSSRGIAESGRLSRFIRTGAE